MAHVLVPPKTYVLKPILSDVARIIRVEFENYVTEVINSNY